MQHSTLNDINQDLFEWIYIWMGYLIAWTDAFNANKTKKKRCVFRLIRRSVQRDNKHKCTQHTEIRMQMQSFVQTHLNYLYEYWFLWLSVPTNSAHQSKMYGPNKFSILNRQVFCFISFHSAPCLISFTHTICNFIVLIVSRNLREQCMKIMMMVCDIISAFYAVAILPIQSIINSPGYGENKIKTNTKFI